MRSIPIPSPQVLDMPDAEVLFYPALFVKSESDAFFQALMDNIQWEQRQFKLAGKDIVIPRLTAWYGDAGKSYTYSGMTFEPHTWTSSLLEIKGRVEETASIQFNSVLLNLYRNEQDSVSWHSDDEPELGTNPAIASVSFGAQRAFQFKHKQDPQLRRTIELTTGSLLLMRGTTQAFWKHQIPKAKTPCSPRINLTFRIIS